MKLRLVVVAVALAASVLGTVMLAQSDLCEPIGGLAVLGWLFPTTALAASLFVAGSSASRQLSTGVLYAAGGATVAFVVFGLFALGAVAEFCSEWSGWL